MGGKEMVVENKAGAKGATDEVELNPEEEDERGTWGNQCEFFLSCLGYAVGFGNVWRFPYLCYKNGGAVFLIPYVVMLFIAGLPLFFMELALGQYISLGPNILFPNLAPIFTGLGYSMLVISTLVAIYYNMILAWTLFYTFASFSSVLPWSHCNGDFNSPGCFTSEGSLICKKNDTVYYNRTCVEPDELCLQFQATPFNQSHCIVEGDNSTEYQTITKVTGMISASEDYFKNRMLGVTGTTWEDMGEMRWELVGCLALAWVIVGLCLIKGVKSSGKVVYFTALFPYAVLVILFIRGVTLEGAYKGIEFYIMKANTTKLLEPTVWNDAATQIFYSLGSSFGGLITLASYNKFKNNCMRDAMVIAFANCATSVFAGFVIFSILGFMATELQTSVENVVDSGSGLAFVAYPEAVTKMPIPTLWALLFFAMLITLGLDSQFTMVETLTTAIFDQFKSLRSKKPIIVIGMCFCLFLCGLTMCLQGGIYMFELFNSYSAGLSVIILAITEIVAVQYVYGMKNFMNNIREGMGIYMPGILYGYWAFAWAFLTPVSLLVIFGFSLYYWEPVKFGNYSYPSWVHGLGWVICASSFVLIPIFAIYAIYRNRADGKSWKKLFEHSDDFCPRSERRLRERKGAAFKGHPEGIYRYVQDNEGFSEAVASVYPRIGTASKYDNYGYEDGEARAYSTGGLGHPPPYTISNNM